MKKRSAGILLHKSVAGTIQVLLVHPGGPFWAKKDLGAWSIPKGEFPEDEDPITAAKREFSEEIGQAVPNGDLIDLGSAKQSSKEIFIWALQGDVDATHIESNMFEMEWPPRSGQKQQFPEIDKAAWFTLEKAAAKLVKGQVPFLERLAEKLDIPFDANGQAAVKTATVQPAPAKKQTSLF